MMAISTLSEVTGYAFRAQTASADLTAPATPSPVSLVAGSTALGSTLIGSWSASVTVAALVIPRSGPAPTATVTGSGAGPYSVSIASGLSDGGSYLVILTGTAADGQVASTSLLVAVASPADLTAPLPPSPVSLVAGSTSLGSTAIGSWSAAVTVTANVSGSDGSSPVATVTGSGAGPYSVSIASGLTDGVTYSVTLSGTGADGQVARVGLSVAVQTPATVVGTIQWQIAADYDYSAVATSASVSAPGTVPSGNPALPDLTLAQDLGGTYSVTPTNGVGMVLSNTGAGRPYVSFIPNWAGIGIDPLGPEGWLVELLVSSPVQAASSFFSYMVGSSANPNGSGSGMGARCLNSAGTRTIIARSVSLGTAELGSGIVSSAGADFPALSLLGGGFPAEIVGSGLGSTLPAGPSAYTIYRDGFTRTPMGMTWGLSPGHVALLFGGATLSGVWARVRFWRRVVL
jgi:hypothetical protein